MIFHRMEEAADVVIADEAADPLAVSLDGDRDVPGHAR